MGTPSRPWRGFAPLFLASGLLALSSLQCMPPPATLKQEPRPFHVAGPPYLQATLTSQSKRTLNPNELAERTRTGYRWDLEVAISNSGSTPVTFTKVSMNSRSLAGVGSTQEQAMEFRVAPGERSTVQAFGQLSASQADSKVLLKGNLDLILQGRTEAGEFITLTVTIPLE